MDRIHSIGAAPGITICKIQVIHQATLLLNAAEHSNLEHEWQCMLAAQQHGWQTMSWYHEQAHQRYSSEMVKIYKVYRLMLQDAVYLNNIKQQIDADQRAESSISLKTELVVLQFEQAHIGIFSTAGGRYLRSTIYTPDGVIQY